VRAAWAQHAPALAAWVDQHLVNRRDAFGHYKAVEDRQSERDDAYADKSELTREILERHFQGQSTGDIIGLYTTACDEAGECWSLWLAVDIDRHEEDTDPAANWTAAQAWFNLVRSLGLKALLLDSNGNGGYHLVILFDAPVPTERVFALGRWLIRDWRDFGLGETPELFPKQARIKPGGFGNWIRLPGRHHTRDHHTRAWDGSGWLEGEAAIRLILETAGGPAAALDGIPLNGTANGKGRHRPHVPPADVELARSALAALDNSGDGCHYDDWLAIGMALKDLGDEGRALWHEWSKQSAKFDEATFRKKWASFQPGRNGTNLVGLGTLFERAKRAGWVRPKPADEAKPEPEPSAKGKGPTRQPRIEAAADDQAEEEVIDRWPRIKDQAFTGIAGDIVKLIAPHTEADPVAILAQLLIGFGNLVDRGAHFVVGRTWHYLNLFGALVGFTAVGRKGSSLDIVRWILGWLDEDWADQRIQGGLVSGEGLIHAVRDADPNAPRKKGAPPDPGVADKRLLVVETELSRALKAMNRDSNTLSDVLRQAWDGMRVLRTLGKNNPVKATCAHISLIAHATQADIRRHLSEVDSANGFANRFTWLAVRRSRELPEGGDLGSINFTPIQERLIAIARQARGVGRMTRDADAREIWRGVYGALSGGRPGLLGAVLSRAEAQVMRLACVYALLDGSATVQAMHLLAALALWDYAEASARFIFGNALGDPDAEKLLAALRAKPEGLTRTEITRDVFDKHKTAKQIAALLSELLTYGLIHRRRDASTGGRPAERWRIGRGD
jgi:hypothetical protein